MEDERLKPFRTRIDEIDRSIIDLVGKRIRIVREIARFKAKSRIPMMQKKRLQDLFDSRTEEASRLGLDRDFVTLLFRTIVDYSCRIEERIINEVEQSEGDQESEGEQEG